MQTERIKINKTKYFHAVQKNNKKPLRLYEVLEELKNIRMLAQAENKDIAVLTAHNYINGKQYRVVELSTKVFSI